MPRREDLYVNELIPRYESVGEGNLQRLTYRQVTQLGTAHDQFFQELGLNVSDKGIEESMGSVPRVFIMGKDANGRDTIQTPAERKMKIGSDKFWEQVLLGNVFVYPVGASEPVQLQLNTNGQTPKLQYSKPVSPEALPKLPVPPAVRWYHRFANWITRGRAFKGLIKRADDYEKDAEQNQLKLTSMKEARKVSQLYEEKQHLSDIEKENVRLAEAAKKKAEKEEAALQSHIDSVITHHDRIKTGLKNMTSVFQPEPLFNPALEKIQEVKGDDGTIQVEAKSGLYTKEMFANLDVYDKSQIDLSKIKMGKKGEPVTNEEFASVAFFALWDPKNALPEVQRTLKDKWAERSLTEMGLDKTQIGTLLTGQRRNFWTADLFIVPPRDSEGNFFKTVTNKGREDALKAFQAYPGNKTLLAKMLAQGINMAAKDMCVTGDAVAMTDQHKGIMACTSQLIGLMKKDPELKELALQQGMDPENLRAAQGMSEFHKMQLERTDAEYKMAMALKNGEDLPQEEKVSACKAIIKARLTMQQLYLDNQRNRSFAEQKIDTFEPNVVQTDRDTQNKWAEEPDLRPYPGKGKIHMDTYLAMGTSMIKAFTPPADTLKKLGDKNGSKQLDALADEIIKQEGLAEKSTKELFRQLNERQNQSSIDLAGSAVKAAETLAKQQEKKEHQLNGSQINDLQNSQNDLDLK